jgi:hypothetical protein
MLFKLSEYIANAGGNPSIDHHILDLDISSFINNQEKIPRKSQNLNQTQATMINNTNNVSNNMSNIQNNTSNIQASNYKNNSTMNEQIQNNTSNINTYNYKNNSNINEQLAMVRYRGCAELDIGEN